MTAGDRADQAVRIAQHFDLGGGACFTGTAARGEQGVARRLVTEHGSFAVKHSHRAPDAVALERAAAFQARCHDQGAPCPRPLAGPDGHHLAEVDGHLVRVQTWVELGEPDAMLDPPAVGRAVAALHRVVIAGGSTPDEWHTAPVGEEEWRALVTAARRADAPFTDRLEALVPQLIAVEEVITPMSATQWCHLDLWADNLRASSPGPVCAIDFDGAGPADPVRELAMVTFEFARTDRARCESLLAAYAEAGGVVRPTRAEDFGLTVAQLHHLGRYQVRQWLDASGRDARMRAEAGVAEFVDDPFLLPDVERLVSWLRG